MRRPHEPGGCTWPWRARWRPRPAGRRYRRGARRGARAGEDEGRSAHRGLRRGPDDQREAEVVEVAAGGQLTGGVDEERPGPLRRGGEERVAGRIVEIAAAAGRRIGGVHESAQEAQLVHHALQLARGRIAREGIYAAQPETAARETREQRRERGVVDARAIRRA